MMALGANEIFMGPMAYLTAVDTSLNHALSPLDRDNDRVSVSLDELTRVIRLWRSQQCESADKVNRNREGATLYSMSRMRTSLYSAHIGLPAWSCRARMPSRGANCGALSVQSRISRPLR